MLLPILILAPLTAAVLCAFAGGRDSNAAHRLALVLSLAVAASALPLLVGDRTFDLGWFALWGTDAEVRLRLGADGLSAWLVNLVAWLTPMAILAARDGVNGRIRDFAVGAFVAEALMIGALLARDLVVFYVCFEGMLVPMLVLIALFGGAERRSAALWFTLYTMAGSLLLLVAVWWIARSCGTTDLALLPAALAARPADERALLFGAFVLAFAVKAPLVPLHGWQARTYGEAPGAVVVLLGGAMAKLGVYGFLRWVLPVFPVELAAWSGVLSVLALIGVVGGAAVAIVQEDAKRMLAYSSLSHLGLVLLGVFSLHPTALAGVAVQMVAHGLSVSALFLLVAHIERQGRATGIDDFGGLANRAPFLAVLFVAAALASAGLPGTANFIGELLLLLGVSQGLGLWWAAIAGLSVILGAVYLLTLVQRWFLGRAGLRSEAVDEVDPRTATAVGLLLAAALAFGFYPAPIERRAGPVCAALAQAAAATQPAVPVVKAP